MNLGLVPYREAWELQRALAAAISQGAMPETVILLEHPPVVTLGRRTTDEELHIPEAAAVEIVETDRGGKSTYHAPGQLVAYPILDLKRHGKDVKRYVRDLEQALVDTLAAFAIDGARIEGLTGVWLSSPPRKIASIGVHISRGVSAHGFAVNVTNDLAPFTWVVACGLPSVSMTSLAQEGSPEGVPCFRKRMAYRFAQTFGRRQRLITPERLGIAGRPQPVGTLEP
jgi:lipoyl(octanoyl) transferase